MAINNNPQPPSSLLIGVTPILNGTANSLLFDGAGTAAESVNLSWNDTTKLLTLSGTTGPRVSVESTAAASPSIQIKDGAGAPQTWQLLSGVATTTDGIFAVYDGKNSKARITVTPSATFANIGLNNAAPPFPISMTTATGYGFHMLQAGGYNYFASLNETATANTRMLLLGSEFGFAPGGVTAMYLTANLEFLVNATTTFYAGVRFQAQAGDATHPGWVFYSGSTGDVGTPALYLSKFDNDSTTSQVFVRFAINNNGAGAGQINANGASAAAFGTFSDMRLKENIENLGPQLANICALRPKEFDYIDGSGHQIGFIAQEIEQVFPECVSTDPASGMKMVTGWSKTDARLVSAIQELNAKIDALGGK